MLRIGIVGAGMAGLACAEELTRLGHAVRLFDKGRGPGGGDAERALLDLDDRFRRRRGRRTELLARRRCDRLGRPQQFQAGPNRPRELGCPGRSILVEAAHRGGSRVGVGPAQG